jgi:Holliday junction resolvase RusA-like endonuclease
MNPIEFTIPLDPRTKKNSQQMIRTGGKFHPLPSKAFLKYQDDAGWYIPHKHEKISNRLNVKCLFYMKINYEIAKSDVDLVGLLQAIDDVLKHYGVILDDNCRVIASHDGSRVKWSKENPRTEISITEI